MTAVEPAPELASDVEQTAATVDRALAAANALEAEPKRVAIELKDALEAFHREALVTIVKAMKADAAARNVLFDLVDDPTVRTVFAIHGIIKPDPMVAARQALDSVRPYLQSHGGDVELVSVADGVATVRLSGSCNGCSMSAVTLTDGVREALVQVDGIAEIAVDDAPTVATTSAFIPLESVGVRRASGMGPGWEAGPRVDEVSQDQLTRADFGEGKEAQSFIVTFVDNTIAVFRNECVHQGKPLDEGCIVEGLIECPWHGFQFDAASGECRNAPAAQLVGIPARVEAGRVWIRTGR